jgi:hypothetical protein
MRTPAFPRPATVVRITKRNVTKVQAQEGMTLRQYFAGQALAGIMATNPRMDRFQIVNYAYEIADTMLKEPNEH